MFAVLIFEDFYYGVAVYCGDIKRASGEPGKLCYLPSVAQLHPKIQDGDTFTLVLPIFLAKNPRE